MSFHRAPKKLCALPRKSGGRGRLPPLPKGSFRGLYPLLSLRPNVVRADLESRRAAAECWSCKLYSSFSYSTIHFLCLIHEVFDNIVLVTYICPLSSIRVIIRGTNVTCTLQLSSAAPAEEIQNFGFGLVRSRHFDHGLAMKSILKMG